MPIIPIQGLLIDNCAGCCTCRGRVGNTLEATVVDVVACEPEYSITGVNGFFDDVEWDEATQSWRKLVGTLTDNGLAETYDLYLLINCSGSDGCETWNVAIQALESIPFPRVYNASFFGPGCEPNPDVFGTDVPNSQAMCFVSLASGINGTVNLQAA